MICKIFVKIYKIFVKICKIFVSPSTFTLQSDKLNHSWWITISIKTIKMFCTKDNYNFYCASQNLYLMHDGLFLRQLLLCESSMQLYCTFCPISNSVQSALLIQKLLECVLFYFPSVYLSHFAWSIHICSSWRFVIWNLVHQQE